MQFSAMESKHFNFYTSTVLNVATITNPSGIWEMLIESPFRVMEADDTV